MGCHAQARRCTALLTLIAAIGCGSGDGPVERSERMAGDPSSLPTASIPAADTASETGGGASLEPTGAAEGTPEWYLEEISVLRTASLPRNTDPTEIATVLRDRNAAIVDLATKAVALSHEGEDTEAQFLQAVQYLLEARFQLAQQGRDDDVQALYADVDSLRRRDPKSPAATLADHTMVRFAQTNAFRYGREEPQWLREYARQARAFAAAHPDEFEFATSALAGAGRTCEMHGLDDECRSLYGLLVKTFPKSPHAVVAEGVLRRLALVGKSLELAGPTIDGGFTSAEKHRGRVVLVVFWSSTAKPFLDQYDDLEALLKKYGRFGLSPIGVCLDRTEPDADAFIVEKGLTWPQLFHTSGDRRGWQHPAAVHYGIRDVPSYILADHEGRVVWTGGDTEQLKSPLHSALLRLREARLGSTE